MDISSIREFFKIKNPDYHKYEVVCYVNGYWNEISNTDNMKIAIISERLYERIFNHIRLMHIHDDY